MKNKYLVVGAGGFIGGHLVKKLINLKKKVIAVDIKPIRHWFQVNNSAKNFCADMSQYNNCHKFTKKTDYVLNLACNMGGIGFIENNKTECMLSVMINTNLLKSCIKNKIKKYFFSSSACIYNINLQKKINSKPLKETDAYPAMPEDGYGWEKLFSERMCRHFFEDYGLEIRIGRFHNVYGPHGTFDGGREKAPAAICRKILLAKLKKKKRIEIWGNGKQRRSFLYIDDCINAIIKLFNSKFSEPINIGSEERVSINQLISFVEKISNYKVKKKYRLNMPKGVYNRSSDNTLIKKVLKWNYSYSLYKGLSKTFHWMEGLYLKNNINLIQKFTTK